MAAAGGRDDWSRRSRAACSGWGPGRLSRSLVGTGVARRSSTMGNPAPGGRSGGSDPLEAPRTGPALELRADSVHLSWPPLREPRGVLADDALPRERK